MDAHLQALEVKREGAYRELTEIVKLRTRRISNCAAKPASCCKRLRTPNTRGRWGEIQLRRILEMTGMSSACP